MKKLCAGLLCLLLCLTAIPLAGTMAEETTESETGSTAETTETTEPTEDTGTEPTATEPAGKQTVSIRISVVNGAVLATVRGGNGRVPEGLSYTLTVDGDVKETKEASESGRVLFEYEVQIGDENITVSTEGNDEYEAASDSVTLTYTPQELLGFDFTETREPFDGESGVFSSSWNYDDGNGAELIALRLAGSTYGNNGSGGSIYAILPDVPFGRNPLSYVFRVKGKEVVLPVEALVRTGTTEVHIALSVSNGQVTAKVTDSLGNPVPNHPLTLTVGSTTLSPQTTDAQGTLTFSGVTVSAGMTVTCTAEERTTADGVTYLAATATLENIPGVVQTTDSQGETTVKTASPTIPNDNRKPYTTTTTVPEATTTTKTYATIRGAGTTAVEDNYIVVNVTFDEGVVKAFGLKNSDFEGKARFLIPKETYAGLVQDNNGILMMTARYSPIEVTNQQIDAAVMNLSKYSRYRSETVERVTLKLALLFISPDGTETEVTTLPDADYIVQLPIPAAMKDVSLVAVAAANGEEIATPAEAHVESGYLRFNTKYLSSFTILGFPEAQSAPINKVPTQAVVLVVVGALMLIGSGLLMYFFVIRKPSDEEPGDPTDGPDPDGNPSGGSDNGTDGAGPDSSGIPGGDFIEDIFSNPPAERPEMEDIYSSESRRPQTGAEGSRVVPPAKSNPTSPVSGGVSLGSVKNRQIQFLSIDDDEDDGL